MALPSSSQIKKAVDACRYSLVIAAVALLLVLVMEPLLLPGPTPYFHRLAKADRVEFFKQSATIAVTLLGFLLTAVTILVSLDGRRQIVKELQLGESFKLMVGILLAAIFELFLLAVASITGIVFDDATRGAPAFEYGYEVVLLAALCQVLLGIVLFGVTIYKVAAHE